MLQQLTSASADSGKKPYNEAISAGLKPSNSWAVSDGFTTVTYKKKPAPESVPVNTIKHRRQPLIGVRNSANLPSASKKERSKEFFSRFSPEVSACDIGNSLKQQLSLKRLVCTRLKTKFNSCSSFYISVNEEDFPLINNADVWLSGCIIAPFYGKLTTNQIFSSGSPPASESAASSVVAGPINNILKNTAVFSVAHGGSGNLLIAYIR
jgi:hypothetical protein